VNSKPVAAVLAISKDGIPQVDVGNIDSIAIANISELLSHRIMRQGGNVVHEIAFLGGGYAHLKYNKTGAVLHFNVEGVTTRFTAGLTGTIITLVKTLADPI
jgi:hypothetical protein